MIKARRTSKYPPKQIAQTEGSTIYTTRIEPYDRLVIIKRFDSQVFTQTLEFVVREVQMLMTVNHPNIVKLLEIWPDEDLPVLVMEHGGGTLWDYSASTSRHYKIAYFQRIFGQIFAGLNYLHTNNVIHRDIKSSNILLRMNDSVIPPDPIVKICDFGLGRLITDIMTPNTSTPPYRAPEVLANDSYNEKIDIWGMGCVVYEYIENKVLFRGRDNKEIYQKIKECLDDGHKITYIADPTRHAKEHQPIVNNIVEVLRQTLVRDPENRQSAAGCLYLIDSNYANVMKSFLLMKTPTYVLRKTIIVDTNIRYVIVANMLEMDRYYEVSRSTLALAVDIYDRWLMITDGSEDLTLFSLAAVILASYMSDVLNPTEFESVYTADLITSTVKILFRDIGYNIDYLNLWQLMQEVIEEHNLPVTDDHIEHYWKRVCDTLTNYDQLFAKTQDDIKILLDKIIA